MTKAIEVRECKSSEELTLCVELQRRVFALPELELSPVRHLIVTINAGGFVLGAFAGGEMIGFVLSVPAFLRGEKAFCIAVMYAGSLVEVGTAEQSARAWDQTHQVDL